MRRDYLLAIRLDDHLEIAILLKYVTLVSRSSLVLVLCLHRLALDALAHLDSYARSIRTMPTKPLEMLAETHNCTVLHKVP